MTSWFGRWKSWVSLLPPHFSGKVLPFSLQFSVTVIIFTAATIMLNTLPWCWQSWPFVVPRRGCENTTDAGLEDEGQARSLLRTDGLLQGQRSSTSPAAIAFCLIHVPCNQLPRKTCSLLVLLVLVNWNNYQVAHLRSLQEPQGWGTSRE